MSALVQPIEQRDRTFSPYFFVQSDDAATDRMPLKSTDVEAEIAGVIADVRVTQLYCNEGQRPIEAVYVFPGSSRAAIYGMKMTIGERTIVANVEKRQEARGMYERAREEGKSASLLEQHRPNVFQMNVANIMPGDKVKVELQYTELLVPTDCHYEFVYPTVVGPRYPGSQADGLGAEPWVENPYLREDSAPVAKFDIRVKLSAGMPVQKVACNSHQTDISFTNASSATITLKTMETGGGDRDYILKYRLAGGQIESGLLLYEGKEENFFLLMAQPPEKVQAAALPPREYIFIMDVSGSMNGFPMDIAKTLLKDSIEHLGPMDRFNLLQFSFGSKVLSPKGSVPVTDKNVKEALAMIDVERGSGGTEILPALQQALDLPRVKGMACSIVVITDGYVTVEPEVFDLIRQNLGNASLFAFGIGTSVNRHLIEGMAHVGGGEPFIVTRETEAAVQSSTLRRFIQSPVLTNLKLHMDEFAGYEIEPPALPDLFAERPVLCFGKWRGKRSGTLTLEGRTGEQEYQYKVDVSTIEPSAEHAALRYLWARHTVKLLGDYNSLQQDQERIDQITRLGLQYSLLTDYTSFVAIDSEIRNKKGQATIVNQPVSIPQGVSEFALGRNMTQVFAAAPEYITRVHRSPNLNRSRIHSLLKRSGPPDLDSSERIFEELSTNLSDSIFERGEMRVREKTIGDKVFRLKNGVWVDTAHTEKAKLVRIQRDSRAYHDLLKKIPFLQLFFQAEERILVNIGKYSIEIAPDGKSELMIAECHRIVEAWEDRRL
jgi:Ca-activated chloride channel homolog